MNFHKIFLGKSDKNSDLEDINQHLIDIEKSLLKHDLSFEAQLVNALSELIHRRQTTLKNGYTDELKNYISECKLDYDNINLELEPIEALFFLEAIKPGRASFDTSELLIVLLGSVLEEKKYKNGRNVLDAFYNVLFHRNELKMIEPESSILDDCTASEIKEYKESKKVILDYLQVDSTPLDLGIVQN